ncbi:hypothetical protein L798_01195 [Zootermopsis nevadensis]|uniref:Uncharacterized protein n=1 Tax=Zootermopsis nevadensis TaxID=136037 RepID=A0A067QIZ4_ZOONE|nr:hypothetical protein L798_01195 [Zootermopsis nevadensis]
MENGNSIAPCFSTSTAALQCKLSLCRKLVTPKITLYYAQKKKKMSSNNRQGHHVQEKQRWSLDHRLQSLSRPSMAKENKNCERCITKEKMVKYSDEESCEVNEDVECIYCSHLYFYDRKGEAYQVLPNLCKCR